ncbi:MAG: EF-hand domain-containing protein [Planctomycetes bacterium]|nr:EF-hand domain-containing protein [Planctomycetota bacterium]
MRLPLTLSLITAALALVSAPAFSASDDGGKHRGAHHQKALEKFDANKDGKLDESERAAAKTACQARHAEKEAALKAKHPEAFAAADTSGDGHLQRDEVKAYRQAHEGEREAKLKAKHPEVFAKIDKDGDGHLSKDERTSARAAHKAHKKDK